MNTICILICLALASNASGSIFKSWNLEGPNVVPRNYALYHQSLHEEHEKHPAHNHRPSSHESSQQARMESSESDEHKNINVHWNNKKKSPHYVSVMRVNNILGSTYTNPKLWSFLKDHKDPDVNASNETTVLDNHSSSNISGQPDNLIPVIPIHQDVSEQEINEIYRSAKMAMRPVSKQEKIKFHHQVEAALWKDKVENHLNTAELLIKNKYPTEVHAARTDDGYELTLFRIPPKKPTDTVVLLMHGLLGSSDDWVLLGPKKSIAYQLADAGFDVWLGNARGNKYSLKHISKHPVMNDFWAFSNDEISQIDTPTMIDYILKTTKHDELHYVGHSQAITNILALLADQPWYADKIKSIQALAPMVFMKNVRSPLLRLMAIPSHEQVRIKAQLGSGSLHLNKELLKNVGGALCEKEIGCKNVCSNANFVISGVNIEELEPETVSSILAHLPAGTSTRVIDHYSQGISSQLFRKYDHGAEINEIVYGTAEPPVYDLSYVNVPVSLYYAEDDWLAHPVDVEKLKNILPNVIDSIKVPHKHFSNMDFQFSKNVPDLLNEKIIHSIQNH